MKKVVIAFTLFFCVIGIRAQEGDGAIAEPPHFRVTLELDKPTFFLGELILLHYCVENTGDTPFSISQGGDYRGTYRALRYSVTATDAQGVAQPDPYPSAAQMCMGGLGNSPEVKPGEKWWGSIALHRYAQIDAPGVYTISVSHDLGWVKSSDPKKRTGTAKVEVVRPTEADAKKIVDGLFAMDEDYGGTVGRRSTPYRDVSTLRYPIYLPMLKALAAKANKYSTEALSGLDGIPSPEATQAIIDLMTATQDLYRKRAILMTLNRRLPDPRWQKKLDARGVFQEIFAQDKERMALSNASWRAEMAPAVRAIARALLETDIADNHITGAYVLECIGTLDDAPVLLRALGVALEKSKTLALEKNSYPRSRGACEELLRAVQALQSRGLAARIDAKAPAETAAFLVALAKQPEFRPEGWEQRCLELLNDPVPLIRERALAQSKRPLSSDVLQKLPDMIRDGDTGVKIVALGIAEKEKVLATKDLVLECLSAGHDEWLRRSAFNAAVSINARYEALQRLAKDLDEKDIRETMGLLIQGTVDYGSGGSREAKDEEKIGLRERWEQFLTANNVRLQEGKRFKPGEAGLDPKLFYRWHFYLQGKEWPPKE